MIFIATAISCLTYTTATFILSEKAALLQEGSINSTGIEPFITNTSA